MTQKGNFWLRHCRASEVLYWGE